MSKRKSKTKTKRVLSDEDIVVISQVVSKAVVEALLESTKKEKQKSDDGISKMIDFAIETMKAERELNTAFRFMSLLTRRRF